MAEKRVSVRLVAQGGKEVQFEMQGLGEAGHAAFQKIDQGQKEAAESAEAFARQIADEDRAFRALRASLDPAYAAQQRYAAVVKEANLAVRQGAATQAEASRVIALAKQRLDATRGSMMQTTAAAREMDVALAAAGSNSYVFRNLAYQFNQVGQQGAVTGDYLGALAIQIPDVMSSFASLPLVLLGGAAAVSASLIPSIIGAKDAAEELDKVSLSSIQSGMDELVSLEDRYAEVIAARQLAQTDASDAAIAGIRREIEAKKDLLEYDRAQLELQVEKLRNEAEQARAELEQKVRAQRGATETDTRTRQVDAVVYSPVERRLTEETQAALDENRMQVLELRKMNAELTLQEGALGRVNALLGQGRATSEAISRTSEGTRLIVERQADAVLRAYTSYAAMRVEAEAQAQVAAGMLADMQQEAALRELTARYGADSLQVAEARVAAEREAFEKQVAALDVASGLKEELRAAWEAANGIAAADLLGPIAAAEARSAQLAENLRAAAANAYMMESYGFNSDGTKKTGPGGTGGLGFGLPGVGDPSVGSADLGFGNLSGRPQPANLVPKKPKKVRGGGGGAGASAARAAEREAKATQKVIDGLQDEIRLFNATDEARRLHQELQKAGVDLYSAEGQQISDMVEQLADLERQQQAVQAVEQGIASIADAMAQAIVNGEDMGEALGNVFKQIASDLISSGIRQLMEDAFGFGGGMERASGGGGFFGFLGGLLGGGGHADITGATGGSLTSYDGGGYTGGGSRSGGLDGKGGFLALMHPRESVIDHTKGQAAGGPTSIHVTVNGARGNAEIMQMVQAGVSAGLDENNRNLSRRFNANGTMIDPRRRG